MSTLSPEQWRALAPYLDQALEMEEDLRSAWLSALATENPTLAAQLAPPGAGKAALIGGVVSHLQCSSSDAVYYMILGWEPMYFQQMFAVHPGDLVYAEVGAPAGGTNPSYMFLEDLTTLTYSSYSIPVPYGVTFVGNSAQWIVERWCCRNSGYPYPLANTIGTFFDGGAAIKGNGTYFYPGSQAASTSVLTMVNDGGNNIIELVNQGSSGYEGQHAIFFQTTGCAYTGGCAEK